MQVRRAYMAWFMAKTRLMKAHEDGSDTAHLSDLVERNRQRYIGQKLAYTEQQLIASTAVNL